MDYTKLRKEYNKESFKQMLIEKLGNKCVNCDSDIDVEYHHIVPLALHGTNKLSNIVPLCYKCHQLAHGSINIREIFRAENTGRPKKQLPQNYKDILWDYIYGRIGRKECENLLNLGKSTKIQDTWFYKEFLIENKIKVHKNKIDLILAKSHSKTIPKGRIVAEVEFENGEKIIQYAS